VARGIELRRAFPVRIRQQTPRSGVEVFRTRERLVARGERERLSMAPCFVFVEYAFSFPRTLSCSKYFLRAVTRTSFATLTFAFLLLNQNRQGWYTMANLTFEHDFLAFRTIRPLLVLIRVYPRVSAADFFLCGSACGVRAEHRDTLAPVNVLGWRHQCWI
jgi:hypothetical protein